MPTSSKKTTLADDDDFIRLIQVARDDPEIRHQLLSILSLDPFHRESVLNSWLDQLKHQNAPPEFIRAIRCLTDTAIAGKALELLKSRSLIDGGRPPA
jgi:hypothetical protein